MTSPSENVRIVEVSGTTGPEGPDNCLHCALAVFIQGWLNAHPTPEYTRSPQAIADVADVLGELIASHVLESGFRPRLREAQVMAVCDQARIIVSESARDLLASMDRHRRG